MKVDSFYFNYLQEFRLAITPENNHEKTLLSALGHERTITISTNSLGVLTLDFTPKKAPKRK